jgi:hypothetical protein
MLQWIHITALEDTFACLWSSVARSIWQKRESVALAMPWCHSMKYEFKQPLISPVAPTVVHRQPENPVELIGTFDTTHLQSTSGNRSLQKRTDRFARSRT